MEKAKEKDLVKAIFGNTATFLFSICENQFLFFLKKKNESGKHVCVNVF